MSTPTITRAKLYTRLLFAVVTFTGVTARGEWTVDFSRRQPAARVDAAYRGPASVTDAVIEQPFESNQPVVAKDQGFFASVWSGGGEVAQDVVIMNTDKGFVPATVRLKSGLTYQIHVVNVNDRERNVSFVMDSFGQHHGTFYGKVKTFSIRPDKEGVFSYVSPETAAQGKLVVTGAPGADVRRPAAE